VPITEDGSAIGQNCANSECPDGYECHENQGFQVTYTCEIPCEENCECPEDHACQEFLDKTQIPYWRCAAL